MGSKSEDFFRGNLPMNSGSLNVAAAGPVTAGQPRSVEELRLAGHAK
jgi:hypothetical protein